VGWSIQNIWCDFTGGSLSFLQTIIDSINQNSMDPITGNFAKVALGLLSVAFDIVFLIQHYVLYKDRNEIAVMMESDDENLLAPTDNTSGMEPSEQYASPHAPTETPGSHQPARDVSKIRNLEKSCNIPSSVESKHSEVEDLKNVENDEKVAITP